MEKKNDEKELKQSFKQEVSEKWFLKYFLFNIMSCWQPTIIFTWGDAQLSMYKDCKDFTLGSWIRLGIYKSGSMDSSRVCIR